MVIQTLNQYSVFQLFILTVVISDKVYVQYELNNILTDEQKSCCRNSRGCKDLVRIDIIKVLIAKKHQHNFHMADVDYNKLLPWFLTII